MKRRSFLRTGLAGIAAMAAPLPKLAMVTPKVSFSAGQYAWAVAAAKSRNAVSADILASSLKVSGEQAAALMARLHARGVVQTAGSSGLAKVTAPVFKASGLTGGGVISSGSVARTSPMERLPDVVERFANKNGASGNETPQEPGESENEISLLTDDPEPPAVLDAERSAG